MSQLFAAGRSVHVMGVAGAGMSALARLLAEHGCAVTGCDPKAADVAESLARVGVMVSNTHDPRHVVGVDVLCASPAIASDHPERHAAREAGCATPTRSDVMAALALMAPMIGFAGTHGKTTATSMAVHAWIAAGADPAWLCGAPIVGVGDSSHWREQADLLTELDESYGTFALATPTALGVLNVDADHLDFYGTVQHVQEAFGSLVDRTTGPVALWTDDEGAARVSSMLTRDHWRVGTSSSDDIRVSTVALDRRGAHFDLETPFGRTPVDLHVPGRHNVANAALVAAVALARGLELSAIASGLSRFAGAPRRFQIVGESRGTIVVDDYAHLPAEVSAMIDSARSMGFERIVAVFQPHRITRTVALASSFAHSFEGVDSLIVTDIYSAGEPNPTRATGELVADAVRSHSAMPVTYAASLADVTQCAIAAIGKCDLLLVMGAGDVNSVIANVLSGAT